MVTFAPMSPDGIRRPGPVTEVLPSDEQARGARLLRSFLNRRRLGLLKTEACSASSDTILCLNASDIAVNLKERSTAALGSATRFKIARRTCEDELQRHHLGVGTESLAPADATSAAVFRRGASSGGEAPNSLTAHRDVLSLGGESFSKPLGGTAASAEELTDRGAYIKCECSVGGALRLRSKLQLQHVPAAGAADVLASVSFRDAAKFARTDDVSDQGINYVDLRPLEYEKVDLSTKSDATGETLRCNTSASPARPGNEYAVRDEHASSKRTKGPLSAEAFSSANAARAENTKRLTTDVFQQRVAVEYGEVESSSVSASAQSNQNQQLSCEQQITECPRFSDTGEEETPPDREEHYILTEQQHAAVAAAEAAAAVLRQKIRALQAENERLVCRWGDRETRRYEQRDSNAASRATKACGCASNFLRCYDNRTEPAESGTTTVCTASSCAHDETHILQQQLEICRREVYLLSQENAHLRDLCHSKT